MPRHAPKPSVSEMLVEFFEAIGLDQQFPADDLARKVELILEKSLEEAGIPDPDEFVEWADGEKMVKEWDLVTQDEIKGFVDTEGLTELLDGEDFLKNEELADALETLRVVTQDDLPDLGDYVAKDDIRDHMKWVKSLRERGFFGRVKWLLTGR